MIPESTIHILIVVCYIAACLAAGYAGRDKRIGYWPTVVVSVVLSPIIGLVVGLLSPSNATEAPAPDKYTRLESLARLKESGAITQEEYEAEKRKLLS